MSKRFVKLLQKEPKTMFDWFVWNLWHLALDAMFGIPYQRIFLYDLKCDYPKEYESLVEAGIIEKYYPTLLDIEVKEKEWLSE